MIRQLLIAASFLLMALGTVRPSPAVDPLNLPTQFDIVMLAGADYLLSVPMKLSNGQPYDMTFNTYAAQFRPAPGGPLYANFSTSSRWVQSRYSSNGVQLSASYPVLDIKMSNRLTKPLSGKTGLWDLKQSAPNGFVSYPLSGKVSVRPVVTP